MKKKSLIVIFSICLLILFTACKKLQDSKNASVNADIAQYTEVSSDESLCTDMFLSNEFTETDDASCVSVTDDTETEYFASDVDEENVDDTSNTQIDETVKVEKIDVDNYTSYISYGEMTEDARIIVDAILTVIKNDDGTEHIVVITLPEKFHRNIPDNVYMEAISFLTLYYADFYTVRTKVFCRTLIPGDDGVTCEFSADMDILRELEQERKRYVSLVEQALCNMTEGSETEKLMQIARWIAERYQFEPEVGSASDFWDRQRANCTVTSMVFRLFAERLGIPCDMVIGYSVTGYYHAWNRVKLSDGTYRYYDIVLYNGFGGAYLNSAKSLSEQVYINRYID